MAKRRKPIKEIRPSGGDDTGAIDAALADYRVVRLREGLWHYSRKRLSVPQGKRLLGCGAGVTIVDKPLALNTGVEIGVYEDSGITFGMPETATPNICVSGSHDAYVSHCRFRGRGSMLWDMCDYTPHWSDPVVRYRCDARDHIWWHCEFEHGAPDMFSIWWDCRAGGGSVSGLEWFGCTFGAMNSMGEYSPARVRLLVQPSPPEHASDGPRPSGGWNGKCADPTFDWALVDHGSGLASRHDEPWPFALVNCVFNGRMNLASFDLCDYLRSWVMCHYYADKPLGFSTNGTQEERDSAPDSVTTKGVYVLGNVFGCNYIAEIGRDVSGQSTSDDHHACGHRDEPLKYNATAECRYHDEELYGYSAV